MIRLTKLIVSLCVAGIDQFMQSIRRIAGGRPRRHLVILYYHAVRAESRKKFAWQLDELSRISTPTDAETIAQDAQATRYTAVTFDDGFESVLDNALPELKVRGIPCTIFVPTGCIGRPPQWIESAHYDAEERIASEEVWRTLSANPLVHIGSHSVSHPNFALIDDARALAELSESKKSLERMLGREVNSFSFPHGAYTPGSINLARQCGYDRVYTIEPELLPLPCSEFVVGRVRVEPHDWQLEFRLKVLGAYRWMIRASAVKRFMRDSLRAGRSRVIQE